MDSIPNNSDVFQFEGAEDYFSKMRRMTEARQFGLFFDPL